jgi:hypothetical protein
MRLSVTRTAKICPIEIAASISPVAAGTKGDRREFKRRQVVYLWELSLGRGAEEAGA